MTTVRIMYFRSSIFVLWLMLHDHAHLYLRMMLLCLLDDQILDNGPLQFMEVDMML